MCAALVMSVRSVIDFCLETVPRSRPGGGFGSQGRSDVCKSLSIATYPLGADAWQSYALELAVEWGRTSETSSAAEYVVT